MSSRKRGREESEQDWEIKSAEPAAKKKKSNQKKVELDEDLVDKCSMSNVSKCIISAF